MDTGIRAQAVDFVVDQLKKNPETTMGELKKLAAPKKINIYPLVIGLAKSKLGLGKAKRAKAAPGKRGPGRPPKAGRPGPGRPPKAGRRGPGRPPKSIGTDATSALQNVVGHVRELEREVASLRAALAKIGEIAGGS